MTDSLLKAALQRGLSRRAFLGAAGAFVAWSQMPRVGYAQVARDPRLVVVILRGALDGLATVPPIGDPAYSAVRGALAIGAAGREPALALDGFFGLNDAMPRFHALYQQRQAIVVHASATPYRARSHFDGQDVLEHGLPGVTPATSGWLNRAVAALPVAGSIRPMTGLAISPTVPLILRGTAPVLTWTPPVLGQANPDTVARLLDLYRHTDPQLAEIYAAGVNLDQLFLGGGMGMGTSDVAAQGTTGYVGLNAAFAELADGSARLLADPAGPRVAVLSYDGWDTHANQGPETGRLASLLGALDAALDTLARGMATVWRDTAVVVITEFGRTVSGNGTDGTDHGTGTTAFLLGGAINGGRVIADWPGLATANLFQGRDLMPTTDLRAVLKGVLRDHLGLSETALTASVFPDSIGVSPLNGLIA